MQRKGSTINRRRRGVVLLYACASMMVFVGFVALAIDVARVRIVTNELQGAADAAARAGANYLSSGSATTVTNTATTVAGKNYANGLSVSTSNGMTIAVQMLKWTSATKTKVVTSTSKANAVSVTVSYTEPLTFGRVLGFSAVTASRTATALVSTSTDSPYVYATSNTWLAGEPSGTTASVPDPGWTGQGKNADHPWEYDIAGTPGSANKSGETYGSPIQADITVTPGSVITITNVTGGADNVPDSSPDYNAQGFANGSTSNYQDKAANGVSEHGMSDVNMPINALNAVFLSNSTPDSISTPPPPLDFGTQTARDYTSLQPQLQQVFYTGNGQTSSNQQQQITVPAGATRMFLGTMDGWEWSNNSGGFNVTITQTSVTMVQ